jgi:hypothetical protein
MAYSKMKPTSDTSLVEQVARLIRTFNPVEMVQLLELVPQLQTVQSHISTAQVELIAYFDPQLEALSEYPPMQDDDPFIGGLTVKEFFALSEEEQDRIWNEAYIEAERKLESKEQPVQSDALPAR